MVHFDFDPSDYLDEVPTEKLIEELDRRRVPPRNVLSPSIEDICRDLTKTWAQRDEAGFLAALALLERPESSKHRLDRMMKLYREAMRQPEPQEVGCG